MNTEKKLVLENRDGKVVRSFAVNSDTASLIRRDDTKRIELRSDLTELNEQKIQFEVLQQIDFKMTPDLDFEILDGARIKFVTANESVFKDETLVQDRNRLWYAVIAGLGLLFAGFFVFLFTNPNQAAKLEQELKQQVVQLMKRVVPLRQVKPITKMEAIKTQAAINKKIVTQSGIKRLGALAVLGSSQNSKNKGGIDLGAVNTTAGPGLGGTAGSGGMQTNIYSKGLVAAPLGAGANMQGAGGYGTKGKGGGQAGYGKLSLVGSTGASPIPLGHEAIIGGGLDRDLIASVINKNLGQIRFCYEQGLQGNPSLTGRVAVDFTIAGNGNVKIAQVENTSLNSKMVEDCIIMRLKSWKFPLTENGIDVKVSYPFVLRRSGQG